MNALTKAEPTAMAEATAVDLRTSMQNSNLSWLDGALTLSGPVPATLDPVRTSLMRATKSLDEREFGQLLKELWLTTKKAGSVSDTPFSDIAELYARDLLGYPGTVLRKALMSWKHTPKPKSAHHWFPAPPELIDDMRAEAEDLWNLRRAVDGFNLEEARDQRRYKLRRDLHNLEAGDPHWEDRKKSYEEREAGRLRRIEEITTELEAMEG